MNQEEKIKVERMKELFTEKIQLLKSVTCPIQKLLIEKEYREKIVQVNIQKKRNILCSIFGHKPFYGMWNRKINPATNTWRWHTTCQRCNQDIFED